MKLLTQRVEALPRVKACVSGRKVDKKYHSQALDMPTTKLNPLVPQAKKRGPLLMIEARSEKKQKMDLKDILSERSTSRADSAHITHASKVECAGKNKIMSTAPMSKPNLDSVGAASTLDDMSAYPSSQCRTPATDVTASEGRRPVVFDDLLAQKKALRAATLKHRFADTIFKARTTLRDHDDKVDPMKMQQEKERLERRLREEKAHIECQVRVAETAETAELKKQREKEREAARVALEKMENTVHFEQNMETLKEFERLIGISS